jgi:hypothetical protein
MAWENYRSPAGPIHSCDGGLIASAATIAPQGYVTRVSGTTAVDTITVPYTGFAGSIVLVPTGAFTWTTNGNVGLAGTATVGRAITFTYVPSAAKWYPSVVA